MLWSKKTKRIKIQRGITGITKKELALNRFMLAAPKLTEVCCSFYEINRLNKNDTSKNYQLSGGTNKPISQNVEKLDKISDTFDVDFDKSKNGHNIETQVAVTEQTSTDICDHDKEG